MSLHKTEKARAELAPGARSLSQRERSLLLLADGTKSQQVLGSLFNGEAGLLLLKLLQEGYLEHRSPVGATPPVAAVTTVDEPPQSAPKLPPLASTTSEDRIQQDRQDTTPGRRVAADPFEGKRSLATTRMFLFDICERMFARRDPVMAEHFREALRQARDRDGMLAAGRDMIAEIEKVAGPERADSISERVAMLLPPELVT